MYRIAFTGHRPDKLGGYDWNSDANQRNILKLTSAVLDIIKDSGDTDFEFYFGGALGTDQMAFEIVSLIQAKHPEWNFRKIFCIPFKNQPNKWPPISRQRYEKHKEKAEQIVYVDTIEGYSFDNLNKDIYHPAKMQKRNEYMVDNCDILIALYDGNGTGGTASCLKYAEARRKRILILRPETKD